jgi:hypothetical protein
MEVHGRRDGCALHFDGMFVSGEQYSAAPPAISGNGVNG